ncbi:hypothetical protein T01_9330 [Trichinella spiralis]|uniref:Uncharacterized protein n=1 Tax=Trichinella spiralis TaxID=6334 RepID=A0A0V1AXX1_TRISP|nr:hypothetical protein T01_9330 [Trichinella spiralis]
MEDVIIDRSDIDVNCIAETEVSSMPREQSYTK